MPRTSVTSLLVRLFRSNSPVLGTFFAAVALCAAVSAPPASAAVSVSGGGASSCALSLKKPTDVSGQVFCWGAGSHGRLGRNITDDTGSAIPVLVPDLKTNVIQLDVGQAHACVVLVDHTAKCWGFDAVGQLGIGHPDVKGTGGVITKVGESKILALTLSGVPIIGQTVLIRGDEGTSYLSPGTTITAITGGGAAPYTLTLSKPALRGGSALGVAILDTNATADRIVPTPVNGVTGVAQISAGAAHTCAVLNTGHIYCWGDNSFGQLGNGTRVTSTFPVEVSGITNAVNVTAGYIHSCATLSNGTAVCWGSNRSGQIGDGIGKGRVAPTPVVKADPDGGSPIPLTGVAKLTAGYGHTCALMLDKTVDCWGSNQFTELGTPSITDSFTNVAAPVPGLAGVVNVDTSYLHTCAVTAAKKTYCWGHNTQADTGVTTSAGTGVEPTYTPTVNAPTLVTGLADATDVTTGNGYSCALLAKVGAAKSGAINCWGFGGNGQRGDGTTVKGLSPIAVWGGPDIDIIPPPAPQILAKPLIVTRDRNATFRFMSVDPTGTPVTYRYSVDEAAFVSTPLNSVTFKNKKPGPHTMVVTAVDIWGNVSGTSFYSWKIV